MNNLYQKHAHMRMWNKQMRKKNPRPLRLYSFDSGDECLYYISIWLMSKANVWKFIQQ